MNGEGKLVRDSEKLEGVGGWLWLPIIGLLFSIYEGYKLFTDGEIILFKPELWVAFTTPGTAFFHSWWVPVIIFTAFLQIVIITFTVVALLAILKKKKFVPAVMIGLYVAGLVMLVMDTLIAVFFMPRISAYAADLVKAESLKKLAILVVVAGIWIPYFLRSKRVKNTFTK